MNPAPPVIRHRMADWPCTSHARRLGRILPTPSVPHASHRCFRCARGDAAVHHLPRRRGGRHGGTISSVVRSGAARRTTDEIVRSEEHTSELQSQSKLVCRLLLEKKKNKCERHPRL